MCCVAQFMVVLDVSVVNVALPSIRADLGFSDVDLQWIVNAYTLTFAGFLLLGGRAADLLGRRPVFLGGVALFSLASLAGGLSQGQLELVLARAAQGLGGAVLGPATLSILTTTFTEGSERNRALAYWGAMGAVGGAMGALIGGILTSALGWQWILFINLPVGLFLAVAGRRVIPARDPETAAGARHYDGAGALAVTAGLVVLTFGIVRTDVNGWGSATTLATLAAGLALLAAFVVIEHRFSPRPLMPLRIWRIRSVAAANLVIFFMGSAVFAMWYFASLYMQLVLRFSPVETGLAFLPMTATIAVASTVAGRVNTRLGPGLILTVGMGFVALGMLVFAQVDAGGSYAGDVLAPGLLTAFGIGCSFVTVTIAATSGVSPGEAGLASGLVNTSRQFGGSVGLALLATIASSTTASAAGTDAEALVAGFHAAFVTGAALALAGALVAGGALVRLPRRRPVTA